MSENVIFTEGKVANRVESTKERLIRAAMDSFVAKGYRGTSTADVSSACQVAKPTLFYHFASKQELALAVIYHVHRYCRNMIFDILEKKGTSAISQVEIFTENFCKFYREKTDSKVMILLGAELGSVASLFKAPINNYFEEWFVVIRKVLHLFCEEEVATSIAKRNIERIVGASLLARIYGSDEHIERMCDDVTDTWLKLSSSHEERALKKAS